MKISLYVPKGTKGISGFVEREIATARNIRSRQTRVDVESGLTKIASCV